jgi:electron transfer flavoprotein alpha/beta subunit
MWGNIVRLLTCFKVTYDIEYITPEELLALHNGVLDLSVFQKVIGNYDEAALETTLRLKDAYRDKSIHVEIHALTLGQCEGRFAKNLYALGFDQIICLTAEKDCVWQPEYTARCIENFITQKGPYDAVLTGKQTGPGESSQIPRLLASLLGWPCIPEVLELSPCAKGLNIVSKTDRGKSRYRVIKPAVYAIGEAQHPYLRVATLREKLAMKSKEMVSLASVSATLPQSMGNAEHLHYLYEIRKKKCLMLEGNTINDKLTILWERYLENQIRT